VAQSRAAFTSASLPAPHADCCGDQTSRLKPPSSSSGQSAGHVSGLATRSFEPCVACVLKKATYVKLTWLVLGEDPAARSRRVEQFTAL
jgi:hypothetical protein